MFLLRKYQRVISVFFLIVFFSTFNPSTLWANNGGPKQPEAKAVEPIGTTNMVDPFTGNFSYNIPLLDVGGYPINISYSSDPSMEQDASWVGLGWNIGVGNIDRTVRGLPDDFAGDKIHTVANQKVSKTGGYSVGAGLQVFGFDIDGIAGGIDVNLSLGPFYNNYTGYGSVIGLNGQLGIGASKSPHTVNMGVGVKAHSNDGLTIMPTVGYQFDADKKKVNENEGSISFGRGYNTRTGWASYTVDTYLKKGKGMMSGSTPISYARPTTFPKATLPIYSLNLNLKTTIGAALLGGHVNGTILAYYSAQGLKSNVEDLVIANADVTEIGFKPEDLPAMAKAFNPLAPLLMRSSSEMATPSYGYLYSEKGISSERVMHDYNRENDGPFTNNRPNLAIPVYTHDVYQMSGQGIGGMFRPFRNDIGVLHDTYMENTSTSLDFPPLEIGGGNAVHIGVNASVSGVGSTSRLWTDENQFLNLIKFKGYDIDNALYQPSYFKQSGELSARFSKKVWDNFGEFDPVQLSVFKAGNGSIGNVMQVYKSDGTHAEKKVSEHLVNEFRQPRNQSVQFLNAAEAKKFGVEKGILLYKENSFAMDAYGRYLPDSYISRDDVSRGMLPHHISEMSVTTAAGMRYIYGIPSYNTSQKEVSFAKECNGVEPYYDDDIKTGLTYYTLEDNSVSNKNGVDNHYESRNIPAYARSFMLNAILSDDYVDVGEDGPSDDDIGNYTKFNYSQIEENRWRSPVQEKTAHYFEGFRAHHNDGRGSYSYGTRQLWYVHSIETKTHVAQFVLENREDGAGVLGENGGIDATNVMKKLVRIDLFAKPDKIKEVKSDGTYKALPLKSIHFEYDYSLCKGTPNNVNGNGKLTLKKIFFTYQNSQRTALMPYEFTYGFNPNYEIKAHDRWDTYKPHKSSQLNNTDFPYALQNKTQADKNAQAWNLNSIKLPSGGELKVDYESDDYAYVQDKNAMQMFMIKGFGDNSNGSNVNNTAIGDVVFFELKDFVFPDTEDTEEANRQKAKGIIARDYLRDLVTNNDYMYFKCSLEGLSKDYVTGYAKLDLAHNDPYGVATDGNGVHYGYVRLKKSYVGTEKESSADDDDSKLYMNPIKKWGIGLVKNSMPWIASGGDYVGCNEDLSDNVMDVLEMLFLYKASEITAAFGNTYADLVDAPFLSGVDISRSFIRLYNPDGKKLGGGSRVKRITISDDWGAITGNNNNITMSRGQEYSYTIKDAYNRDISSGVASWEPAAGGEENVFKQPIFVSESRLGVPSDEYVLETPLGESFYPSPSVGYSKVTTRDIAANVDETDDIIVYTYNKTGYSESEFYTAKDFPVIARHTPVEVKRTPPALGALQNILQRSIKDYVAASQGYSIEVNDMHGKPKAARVFQEAEAEQPAALLSSVEYKYKTDSKGKLDNEVLVMNRAAVAGKNDFIEKRLVGVDFDFVADMNEHKTESSTILVGGNLETFLASIIPMAIPIVIPGYSYELNQLRTAVTTKVITRYGLIDKVITNDLGKQDVAENEVYDAETGAVIVSSTLNQYGDPVYAVNYPAHYAYDQMGMAYKNAGALFKMPNVTTLDGASDILIAGDELYAINEDSVKTGGKPMKAWVKSVSGDIVELIDVDGFPLIKNGGDGKYTMKVLRSGRRNLQSASLGNVVTLKNPISKPDNAPYQFSLEKVLNASAVEYENRWRTFCDCDFQPPKLAPKPAARIR